MIILFFWLLFIFHRSPVTVLDHDENFQCPNAKKNNVEDVIVTLCAKATGQKSTVRYIKQKAAGGEKFSNTNEAKPLLVVDLITSFMLFWGLTRIRFHGPLDLLNILLHYPHHLNTIVIYCMSYFYLARFIFHWKCHWSRSKMNPTPPPSPQ